jgi:hypothetical protein
MDQEADRKAIHPLSPEQEAIPLLEAHAIHDKTSV